MKFSEFSTGMHVEALDIEAAIQHPDAGPDLRARLQGLRDKAVPGDAFSYYCSTRAQWAALMGSDGYVLVREGRIIDGVVLRMN